MEFQYHRFKIKLGAEKNVNNIEIAVRLMVVSVPLL